jgi:hypothetical protein
LLSLLSRRAVDRSVYATGAGKTERRRHDLTRIQMPSAMSTPPIA